MAALALSLLFAGCHTPYQRIGNKKDGGYSTTRNGKDSYTVTYQGPESSDPEVIYDYALLRSAELTIECGYKFFVVNSDNDRSREKLRYVPGSPGIRTTEYHTTLSGHTYAYSGYTASTPGHAVPVKVPVFTLMIKMYTQAEGIGAPASLTHEAAPLIAELKKKHDLK